MDEKTVTVKYTLSAPPEQVFQAWVQPDLLKQWWCTPGFVFKNIMIDARPAGTYRFEVGAPDADASNACIVEGNFLEVTPGHKLAYTWAMRAPGLEVSDTCVTITLEAHGNYTELTLVHAGLKEPEVYELHRTDWPIVLCNLEELLQRQAQISL
jgi:uncharacterized protein YndB with AHSA1/START domain